MIVAYTRLDSKNRIETVIHQECETKAEAIAVANALVSSSVDNEEVLEVLRGSKVSDTEVKYSVSHEIPR
jgi:hypothetical protein